MKFNQAWKIIWRNTAIFSVFNTLYYAFEWLFQWPHALTSEMAWQVKWTEEVTKTVILPWPNWFNLFINPLALIIFGLMLYGFYRLLEIKKTYYRVDKEVLAVGQVVGLVAGLVVGLVVAGLGVGWGVGLVIGLGVSLVAGLVVAGLGVGWGVGLDVSLGVGWGVSLVVSLVVSMVDGLVVSLVAGLVVGLSVSLGVSLGVGLVAGLRYLFSRKFWETLERFMFW